MAVVVVVVQLAGAVALWFFSYTVCVCVVCQINVPALMRAVKKYQNIDEEGEHFVSFQEF